jgi:hypothetical protein
MRTTKEIENEINNLTNKLTSIRDIMLAPEDCIDTDITFNKIQMLSIKINLLKWVLNLD